MFNILPEILRDHIKSEYKIRRWIIGLSIVIFLQLFFIVSVLPTWIISVYKEKEVNLLIKKEEESLLSQNANNISRVIDSTNKKLRILDNVMQYPEIIPVYEAIIAKKISGIKINEFGYISMSSSTATMMIRGDANSRESLVSFVKNLEDSKIFGKVDSPVSNLTKQKNIEFVVNLDIIKQ